MPLINPPNEPEDAHVRPARLTVNRKVAEYGDVDAVEIVVRVAEDLRSLLGPRNPFNI